MDRLRVLQGHRMGAVQDAPPENTDAQRHDARPARRQDALRQLARPEGAAVSHSESGAAVR